jgi:glycine betaine/proline transport system substrate-binding protein
VSPRTRRIVEAAAAAVATLAAAAWVAMVEAPPDGGGASPGDRDVPRAAREGSPEPVRTLRIGWTAWADAEWVTHLVARILEDRLEQPVRLVMADIGLQYQGLVSHDLDLMLMAWLPVTHADYYQRVSGRVVDLGPIYTRARLGWVVPAYVPVERVASIEDLRDPAVRERFGGRIQGIDPGSGLMRASRAALRAYDLRGFELVPSSAAAMAAALDRAVRRHEWAVVTGWSPHWIFARFDLRYLDDPLGVLGHHESVHGLAREGFDQDFPQETMAFLSRLYVPIEDVEQALLVANEQSVEAAVEDFLDRRADLVDYWVTGRP